MQVQKKMEEMDNAGLDASLLDDDAFNLEAAQDRCILRLIASCCNSEFLWSVNSSFFATWIIRE